jgi:hypothetical protein
MIQNDKKLPIELWLKNDNYDLVEDEFTLSVTTLLKPTKEIVLAKKYHFEVQKDKEPSINIKIGTSVHDSISAALEPNKMKEIMSNLGYEDFIIKNTKIHTEKRSERKFLNYKISGKFDVVYNGSVYDIKTTSTFSYTSKSGDDYVKQLSLYRWLNPELITSDEGIICFIFTDWSKATALKNPDYPQNRMVFREYELLPNEQVEEFLTQKISDIERYKQTKEEDLQDCNDNELWRSQTVYAYYNNEYKPESMQSTKNFTNKQEAYEYFEYQGKGKIVIRQGKPTRCLYCSVKKHCLQNQNTFLEEQKSKEKYE